ncbi:nicotinate-nucleotide--dimethylbenzimidazole phosphoribosyltransferase [Stieleria sp. TO1_6]|uniref:nicotinate-nucleotide--dimethylbenzimidazole phosphoribosyltransferase n=1 Tax=Stieleria tagensis TaxID=2956795 RepID=UPI00209AF9A3|nr:nicotinate-nucleotide--dimethylbenzimidazole phosphoribosyltransferase [Stieleria tagensis]MCO8121064.1 nicotinate-nucleotide--dimethylbenzimidazole phosphoribosyltransferase [Stieleria tagensis]
MREFSEAAEPWDVEAMQQRLDGLCKPPGSLGMIESIAARLCMTQRTCRPKTRPRHVTVFAADHGVTCEGVTAWPSSVTGAVVNLMQQGRTASGVFAGSLGCSYEVVDVGLLSPCGSTGGRLVDRSGRRGTGNLMREPAMDEAEFSHAWQAGVERAQIACDAGNQILMGGEMGIGNTTSASCLIALLCDNELVATESVETLVGPGAGIDDQQLQHKRQVVRAAVDRVRGLGIQSPDQLACQVGGFEIVALAGFFQHAAQRGRTVVVDGLIATAAALLAQRMHPGTSDQMIAGHRSTEPGQTAALASLDLVPVLDLQMRLGEATGALAALPLIDLAAAMINDMATLDELEL